MVMNIYHMRFLVHIDSIKKLNLPYFLLKSLTKIDSTIRKKLNFPLHGVFHQGLIKILISNQLHHLNRSWEHFLFWGGFQLGNKRHEMDRNEKLEALKDTPARHTKCETKKPNSSKSTIAKRVNLKGEFLSSTVETRSVNKQRVTLEFEFVPTTKKVYERKTR